MALENVPIFFQLASVERQNFGRCVVGLVFEGHYLEAVSETGDIHVCAFVAALGILFFQASAGINSQSNIRDVSLFADVDPAQQGFDIHLLVLTVGFFLHIYAARRQE